jgi:hypothetical protein
VAAAIAIAVANRERERDAPARPPSSPSAKRAHMTLLVRIKNTLSREQQAALNALRDST